MKWDVALRIVGIIAVVISLLIWLWYGDSPWTLYLVIAAIGTLVMPEFVDSLPFGPTKDA